MKITLGVTSVWHMYMSLSRHNHNDEAGFSVDQELLMNKYLWGSQDDKDHNNLSMMKEEMITKSRRVSLGKD